MVSPYLETLSQHPNCRAFRIQQPLPDDFREWHLIPADAPIISERIEGFWLLAARHVLCETDIRDCYLEMIFPECWAERAHLVSKSGVPRRFTPSNLEGEIVPAIAIEFCFRYEMYYSKSWPQVGIDVLRKGLEQAKRTDSIAANLGYIFRDEKRTEEAIEMFKIAVEEAPSGAASEYHCAELVHLYRELGDTENEDKYAKMAPSLWIPGRDYFPKCEPESLLFPIGLPESLAPELLQFANDSSALRELARGVVQSPGLDGLYALADALEEHGYSNNTVLSHLRGGYHPSDSCLVLNWLLGKVNE